MVCDRWPEPQVIRALKAALEAGNTLVLGARKFRHVVSFYGLSTAPRPAGLTPRQWAARQNWIRRRAERGESGVSDKGRHNLMLNLVSASIAKKRKPRRTHCQRWHKLTQENTRWTSHGRSCRACERIARGRRRQQRLDWRQRQQDVREAREQMKALGIKNHQPSLSVEVGNSSRKRKRSASTEPGRRTTPAP
jgi:hypothetical protein